MEWYVCVHCGAVFNSENAATESFRHTEVTPTYTENFLACPGCLSTDFEDAATCYRCHEPVRYKDLYGGYYCKECIRELRDRHHEHLYVGESLDDFAEWIHARRIKNHAEEQDPQDT